MKTLPKNTIAVRRLPPGSSGSPASVVGGAPPDRSIGLSAQPAIAVPETNSSSAHAAASVLIRMRALIGVSLRGARDARGHPARPGCECGRKRKCLPRLRGPRGGQALDPLVRGGGSPWWLPNQGESFPGNHVTLGPVGNECQRISKSPDRSAGRFVQCPPPQVGAATMPRGGRRLPPGCLPVRAGPDRHHARVSSPAGSTREPTPARARILPGRGNRAPRTGVASRSDATREAHGVGAPYSVFGSFFLKSASSFALASAARSLPPVVANGSAEYEKYSQKFRRDFSVTNSASVSRHSLW